MSEDKMLDESIQKIVEAMTALAGLKSILEARREDKPEEGRTYSLSELSKTGKWSESEVVEEPKAKIEVREISTEPPVRVIDVDPKEVSNPLDMEDEDSFWAAVLG